MQNIDNQFQSLGICQRLFKFFMNFIARPFKRITSGHGDAVPHSSTEVPVDDSLWNGVGERQVPLIVKKTSGEEKLLHQGQGRSTDTGSGSEIQVHFKQTEEELEHWTPVDKLRSSVHKPVKGSLKITDGDQLKLKKGDSIPISLSANGQLPDDKLTIHRRKKFTEPPQEPPLVQVNGVANGISTRGKAQQGTDSKPSTTARARGPKLVIIQDSKEEDRAKKGKNIISENLSAVREQKPKEEFPRHLISVESNINEKSDAFIQRKKEAMRRNLSLERKKP